MDTQEEDPCFLRAAIYCLMQAAALALLGKQGFPAVICPFFLRGVLGITVCSTVGESPCSGFARSPLNDCQDVFPGPISQKRNQNIDLAEGRPMPHFCDVGVMWALGPTC